MIRCRNVETSTTNGREKNESFVCMYKILGRVRNERHKFRRTIKRGSF